MRESPILVLMPSDGCNSRCVACDIWKAASPAKIPVEQLERQLPALRQLRVKQVVLTGGEALLHPELWEICALLKQLEIEIVLLTNGLLLERQAAEVVRWCHQVIVSLDGSQGVHDAIRGVPGGYDRLRAGIEAVTVGTPGFKLGGRCVVQRGNYLDLPNVLLSAREIGLDWISFLPVDVSTAAFGRGSLPGESQPYKLVLSPDEVATFGRVLEGVIKDHARDFDSGFIRESPEKLRRVVRYFAALQGDGDFPPVRCNAPWVSAVVEAGGDVRPCFFHPAYGNLDERSLAEIVSSPEAALFRGNLHVGRDPICRRCVCTLYRARQPLPWLARW